MLRLALVVLAGCGSSIERLSLASTCEDADDQMRVTIDGLELCGRARLTVERERETGNGVVEIPPGAFSIGVGATLSANDGTTFRLWVGHGMRTWLERATPSALAIAERPFRRSDKTEIHTGGWASLGIAAPLEAVHEREWVITKGGLVELEHYDLTTGRSKGSFEVVFEGRIDVPETRRVIHATGRFETATPVTDDDGVISAN